MRRETKPDALAHVSWLMSDVLLQPGWYRLTLDLRTPEAPGLRKRGELLADDLAIDAFEWNDALREDLVVRLPHPVRELRLAVKHAEIVHVKCARVQRIGTLRAGLRALRLKLGLLATYNCVGPVLRRGLRLLARGEFASFTRKLFKGLTDARSMRIEVKQAAEANAAWWRRRALPAEDAARLRAEAAALPNPPPILVVIPADAPRAGHARQAALSVFLQVYPHWQLRIAVAGKVPPKLAGILRGETRAAVVSAPALGAAMRQILGESACECVLVLPPDWELAEVALLRFAQAGGVAACEGAAVLRRRDLQGDVPDTVPGVLAWADAKPRPTAHIPEALAAPMNGGRLVPTTAPANGPALVLAANIRGISGWDYLAFSILKGLRSRGFRVRPHPRAGVSPDLIPPEFAAKARPRRPADAQLIVAPPFAVGTYKPDARSSVFTMWECDRVPAADVAALNRAGLVIVPSAWAVESFRASGVTVPMARVPLGYDPLVFHPRPGSPPVCTFGTAGALGAGGLRKNVDLVVRLFREAFPTQRDVRLRVKITPNCPPFDLPDDPRIDVLRATLPHAELAAWNRSLTAYVNASFAEGFGLHLLEAMACGVPLISTCYGGPAEFFDASCGIVIPHTVVPTRNAVYEGHWAKPDEAAILDAMRTIYRDGTLLGERAAARARCFTWRDAGRKLAASLAGRI